MEKKDAEKMRIALKTVHEICKKEMGKGSKFCKWMQKYANDANACKRCR